MKSSRVETDYPWQQFLMMERKARDVLKEGKAAEAENNISRQLARRR
jgi:hypothetical protein